MRNDSSWSQWMNKLVVGLFLFHAAASAQEQIYSFRICPQSAGAQRSLAERLECSAHYRLAPTTPQLVALVEWHRSLLSNDFRAYRDVVLTTPDPIFGRSNDEMLKATFDSIRNTVPVTVMITAPWAMPSGNFLVHAFGCKEGHIQQAIMALGFDGKQWRVLDGVWSPDESKTNCSESRK